MKKYKLILNKEHSKLNDKDKQLIYECLKELDKYLISTLEGRFKIWKV